DIRNGALIQELDATTEAAPIATPTPTPTPKKPKKPGDLDYYDDPLPPEPKDIYVTNVPAEFRRVELFIAGTVPARSLLPISEEDLEGKSRRPAPSPTPLDDTWQDLTEPPEERPSTE